MERWRGMAFGKMKRDKNTWVNGRTTKPMAMAYT
jgi:hypothetical protein